VIDMAPVSPASDHGSMQYHRSGSMVNLSMAHRFMTRSLCGQRDDSFLVRILFYSNHQSFTKSVVCTGYWDMYQSLWEAIRTSSCHHHDHHLDVTIALPADVCAISPQWNDDLQHVVSKTEPKVVILLTGNTVAARWRSVVGIATKNRYRGFPVRPFGSRTMIRGQDCCSDCAIQQALQQPRRCYLIL
jgi:hypothetical protein